MKSRTLFDFPTYCEIDKYVRQHFPDLSSSEFALYHAGLPYLERVNRVGLGGQVIANGDDWAKASGVTAKTYGKAIVQLTALGLVDLRKGDGKKRLCNIVRRRMIPELRKSVEPGILHAAIPEEAEAIAERLQRIPIVWNGETVTPSYSAAKTGRIYMAKPNLQSSPSRGRFNSLQAGIPDGWTLVSCDYKNGEPTLLFHALRRYGLLKDSGKQKDIYQRLASLRRIDRSIAKKDFLRIVYSPRKDLTMPEAWQIPPDDELHGIVSAINQYRHHLWKDGIPTPSERRHVLTLLGRKISTTARESMHRGKLLSWQLQGTLADIFLNVLSRILDLHNRGQLVFCLQLHDSIIAAFPEGTEGQLKKMMEEEAQKAGTELKAEEEQKVVKGVNLHPSGQIMSQVKLPPKGGQTP